MDGEGKKDGKGKDEKKTEEGSSRLEEEQPPANRDINFSEAEWSISEHDLKRKERKQIGNKSKRRRMERLEGWGLSKEGEDIPEKGTENEDCNTKDWEEEKVRELPKSHQTDISEWIRIEGDDETLPEGRKAGNSKEKNQQRLQEREANLLRRRQRQ